MKRHELRQRALQALYQMDVGQSDLDAAIVSVLDVEATSGWTEPKAPTDSDYAYVLRLVSGARETMFESDQLLETHVQGWRMDRIGRVELNVLRLALYELTREADVDVATIVDEAVELAKDFSTDESGRFVNGVLSRLLPYVTQAADRPVKVSEETQA